MRYLWVFTPATHQSALRRWEPEPGRRLTYKTIVSAFSWEEELYNKGKASTWQRKIAGSVWGKLALLMQ